MMGDARAEAAAVDVVRRREYQRKYYARPEVRASRREYQRKYHARPEVRASRREYMRAYHARPEVVARNRDLTRDRLHARPRPRARANSVIRADCAAVMAEVERRLLADGGSGA